MRSPRSTLACLLAFSALAAPAAAVQHPDLRAPDARQDLRSPDTRDAANKVPYGTPPQPDDETPWALIGALGLALPIGGGAAWAVRRRTARVRVAG